MSKRRKPNANSRQVGGEHYRKGEIQHWDYVYSQQIPYHEAQISRYLERWREKGGVEDLEKAQHYLDKLFEIAEAEGY